MTFMRVLEKGPKRNEVDEKGIVLFFVLYFVFNSFLFGRQHPFRKVTIRKVQKTLVRRGPSIKGHKFQGSGRRRK